MVKYFKLIIYGSQSPYREVHLFCYTLYKMLDVSGCCNKQKHSQFWLLSSSEYLDVSSVSEKEFVLLVTVIWVLSFIMKLKLSIYNLFSFVYWKEMITSVSKNSTSHMHLSKGKRKNIFFYKIYFTAISLIAYLLNNLYFGGLRNEQVLFWRCELFSGGTLFEILLKIQSYTVDMLRKWTVHISISISWHFLKFWKQG